MLQSNLAVQARIFRNIVDILAGKIVEDNVRIRDHLRQRGQHENRVREHRRRTQLAVDLLVEEMGIDRDQVQAKLDDQMQHDDRMRILIVDDEEEILRLMRRTLEDYDTVEAHNGEEALYHARRTAGGSGDHRYPYARHGRLSTAKSNKKALPRCARAGHVGSGHWRRCGRARLRSLHRKTDGSQRDQRDRGASVRKGGLRAQQNEKRPPQ
jgi:CheY-like chemotaxis protein